MSPADDASDDAPALGRPRATERRPSTTAMFVAPAVLLVGFVVVLVIVVGFAGPPAVDVAVLHFMEHRRTRTLTALFETVTTIGSPLGLVVTMLVAAGWLSIRRRSWSPVVVGAATLVGAELLGSVVKLLVGRTRPALADRVPDVSAYGLDFPSGHSTQSAAAYTAIALLIARPLVGRGRRRLLYLAAAAGAGLVGLSRLYLGVHWFTDVVASWLLGVSWALIVWAVNAVVQRRRTPDRGRAVSVDRRGRGVGRSG